MDRAADLTGQAAGGLAAAHRRSWFEGPRLWPALGGLLFAVVATALTVSTASGRDPLDGLATAAFVSAGAVGGMVLKLRWVRRDWRRLHEAGVADGQDPLMAESVVRDGVGPADEDQRQLALRIGEQRWRDTGGWVQGPVLAALAVAVLVVLAVTSSPWWWPLCGVAAVAVVGLGRSAARLAHRCAELEGLR